MIQYGNFTYNQPYQNSYQDIQSWLNENKEEWLESIFINNKKHLIPEVLLIWESDRTTESILQASSINDLMSLGFANETANTLMKELRILQSNMPQHYHSTDKQKILGVNNSIQIDVDHTTNDTDYISPAGNFSIGGFHISSHGIEVIPKSVTPLVSARNSVAPSKCPSPQNHEVPRFTKAATVLLKQIGKGGSAEVMQGLYLPTMTMLAIKTVRVESPSIRKQMLTELKALYSLSRYPLSEPSSATSCGRNDKQFVEKLRENIWDLKLRQKREQMHENFKPKLKMNDVTYTTYEIISRMILYTAVGISSLIIFSCVYWRAITFQSVAIVICIANVLGYYEAICSIFVNDDYDCMNLLDSSETESVPEEIIPAPIPQNFPSRITTDCSEHNKDGKLVAKQTGFTELCPYFVKFYDAYTDTDDRTVCIVLEHMDGGSLQNLIDANIMLTEDNIAVIAYSVLQALLELRKRHIIHRDIKPGNILFDHEGHVKLSDFGIVSEMSDLKTSTDTFTGTVQYMSPERMNGSKYSYKSDIWSLGITLAALIKAKAPFPQVKCFWGLLDAVQADIVREISQITSVPLSDLINRCLRTDPSNRPDAANLLNHPFILNAIENGVIKPPEQPTLIGISVEKPTDVVVENIVEKIMEWHFTNCDDENNMHDTYQYAPNHRLKTLTHVTESILTDILTPPRIQWLCQQLRYEPEKMERIIHTKIKVMKSLMHDLLAEIQPTNDQKPRDHYTYSIGYKRDPSPQYINKERRDYNQKYDRSFQHQPHSTTTDKAAKKMSLLMNPNFTGLARIQADDTSLTNDRLSTMTTPVMSKVDFTACANDLGFSNKNFISDSAYQPESSLYYHNRKHHSNIPSKEHVPNWNEHGKSEHILPHQDSMDISSRDPTLVSVQHAAAKLHHLQHDIDTKRKATPEKDRSKNPLSGDISTAVCTLHRSKSSFSLLEQCVDNSVNENEFSIPLNPSYNVYLLEVPPLNQVVDASNKKRSASGLHEMNMEESSSDVQEDFIRSLYPIQVGSSSSLDVLQLQVHDDEENGTEEECKDNYF